jgi:hypothetical protein
VSTVKTTTYTFGFIGGAIVGLLIALQLTLIDKRVRSLSQLSKRFESQALLGMVTTEASSVQHVAAAIVARAQALSISSVALVPVDKTTEAQSLAEKIHAVTSLMGVATTPLTNISSLTAQELVSSISGMVALVTQGVSTMDEVTTTWSVLENAQKPIVGVIFTDSAI